MMNKEVLRLPQGAGAVPAAPDTTVIHDWQLMHHVPGRLRVRAAALRRNRDRAEEIDEMVKAVEGVSAAAVNLVTGSLTIVYEPDRVNPNAILAKLRQCGLTVSPVGGNRARELRSETAAGRMGRAVLYLVLEHVMERSVKAAMAALL